MREIIIRNMKDRFNVLNELAKSLTQEQFCSKLDVPKSKSVEEHLWCIIGARESYFRALLAGQWQGFHCSLADDSDQSNYERALQETQARFDRVLCDVHWSESTEKLLASLYEHEVMHEGQMIRLVYGLGLEMPQSSQWA
ncbi:DinB family protein [Celerinatantimonas diazotrophica]|uniref:Damage-inducible protein DinB n=1 Tax=Celerinatantimonas diazotrophica TaxID=412034 RepID=A0A4R1J8I9_9GAMM|nr:hypothetical protein [Celerinatantimonas diazotrophica]TCK46654.1 hypothetical protein EV690_3239 [Celerinatantimonas diazotrophica]CAG9295356.1 hypothetical protein CEDIAZO_00472 [Celerinatantimonas diazotrophica]